MRTKQKGLLALLLAALVLTLAAACGDGETTPAASEPKATATPKGDPIVNGIKNANYPQGMARGFELGKADAPLTLDIFEDFQCPFCLQFTAIIEPTLLDEYVATGKLLIRFRNFPILGPESVLAAGASVRMAREERFWPFHKELFLAQAEASQISNEKLNVGRFSVANLKTMVAKVGGNADGLEACLGDDTVRTALTTDVQAARDAGLRGTPGFILNGQPLASPPANVAEWRRLLDGAGR
jgi:protein-disulfide isomerase